MLTLRLFVALLGSVRIATAKAVFAHFMVENAKTWDASQWETDIDLAREAHIDGFALNVRTDDEYAEAALITAFGVADAKGDFKMMLSLDYAGGGAWSYERAEGFISTFSAYDSYYMVDGRPFISTFEGPGSADDWELIKADTNCFVVPDWSSLGAQQALEATDGVIDGLFAWSAWPWGDMDMNTYVDASYLQFMETAAKDWGKNLTYMMPVSPWFYTNLPGYDKNWLWRGDSLWFDRWQQIIFLNPDYVEIISWNDFGESHHIGPLYVESDDYQAFTIGEAPFNYAEDMPHDGWRKFLPFVIDLYKNRKATITQEGLSGWYRPSPKQSGCGDGGTVGNTASQLQEEFWPWDIVEDKIFFTALLVSSQSVSVTVGGIVVDASWNFEPENGSGLYHGSATYDGSRGAVIITVGSMTLTGRDITDSCDRVDGQNGQQNWNAWVGSVDGAGANTVVDISLWVCIEGSAPGAAEFNDLCEFSCKYGYCPPGACYCSKMGEHVKEPESTGIVGYPAEGMSASYQGLCTFTCNLGYCPSNYCDTEEHALIVPNVSPFTPDACTVGSGDGDLAGLCSYACNYGYCPIHSCTCSTTGPLVDAPAQTSETGYAVDGLDPLIYDGLCAFACSRGYCPDGTCIQKTNSNSDANPVYLGTEIWSEPTAYCEPPCVFVLPPSALPATTTITVGAYVTSLEVGTTTTTITVTPPAITTGSVPFYNVNVTSSMTDGAQFVAYTSISLDPLDVTLTYITTGQTQITTRKLSLPPYPQITQGPPESWTETYDVWGGGGYWGSSSSPTFVPTDTSTTTTSSPTPTWTEFPPIYVTDNDEGDDDNEDDDDDIIVIGCNGWWFFNICIDFPEFAVTKWKIRIPTGHIGPGPPPPSVFHRDGWTIKFPGPLPPWPNIVIPPGSNPVAVVPDPPDDCNVVSQEVLFETVSQGLSVSDGKTVTTTESTITRTATILGCEVADYTETISSCVIAKRTEPAPAANIARPTSTPPVEVQRKADFEVRADPNSIFNQDNPAQWVDDMTCPGREADYILYPKSHQSVDLDLIRQRLSASTGTNSFEYLEVSSATSGYVAYYVVRQMPYSMVSKISQMTQVRYLYDYINFLTTSKTYYSFGTIGRRGIADGDDLEVAGNDTAYDILNRRDVKIDPFDLSQLSAPGGTDWLADSNYVTTSNGGTVYNYFYDPTEGAGQTIFVIEDSFSDLNSHVEFQGLSIPTMIAVPDYGPTSNNDPWHGSSVLASAVGQKIGVAPRANVIPVALGGVFQNDQAVERIIHALLLIYDYISNNNLKGKVVINMSWGVSVKRMQAIKPFGEIFVNILKALQTDFGAVLVAASGNNALGGKDGRAETVYPQKYLESGELPDMLVVGSVDRNARRWQTSSYFTDTGLPMVYAWGHLINTPNSSGDYDEVSGTSFAAPKVAGLVAYFRGLNSQYQSQLTDAKIVVELVRRMTRKLKIDDASFQSIDVAPDTLVWNGQIQNVNCLVNKISGCPSWLSPGGSGGKAGSISFANGDPSPTCTAECGILCTGYYCDPQPTGTPPDYADPANPITKSDMITTATTKSDMITTATTKSDMVTTATTKSDMVTTATTKSDIITTASTGSATII